MADSFTIADVLDHPGLDTRLLSGGGGLDRRVLWAHACELADPGRWLGPHELLMTVGLCVPAGSQAQRAFIARLDEAGLAGITIGEDGRAPRITRAMLDESERREFPLMRTGPHTPFVALGRTVAEANADRRTMDVLVLAKLYQAAGAQSAEERRSGTALSDIARTPLTVVDDQTGCVVIGEGVAAPAGMRRHALRTLRPTSLILSPDARLDGFTLVHLLQVLAVDASALLNDAVAVVREGGALLSAALSGGIAERRALLQQTGEEPFRLLVTDADEEGRLSMALALEGSPALAVQTDDTTLLLVRESVVERVKSLCSVLGISAGMSASHRELADFAGALDEASAEYRAASAEGPAWREFDGRRVSLLARSMSEADEIVRTVLGPLATESGRNPLLRDTLFVFLEQDRRWHEAAEMLGIHRQTLVSRVHRIEALTGRSLRSTADLSECWLARRAWALTRET